ncbi:MAG TPA: methylamine utilization protein [Gammaproteobacteria bacterium]|nr:methylamine utilization protein [Gammaproteobacteria bacterium]
MHKSPQQKRLRTAFIATALFTAGAVQAGEVIVDQHNKTFIVEGNKVEAITINVGDTVRFRNDDPFFHNIFSLSDLKTFDLGSFPKGQSKTVTFDKAGMVEVECAIHPEMFMEVTIK